MNNKAEKILKRIIFIGSILILFLPVFFNRYIMYPYIFSKIIAFQVLVEIIFIVWLFLLVRDKKYRPNWKNHIVLFLTIFAGILFLSALCGVDFFRSFWSTQERMTGVLAMIHFWLWFIILTSTFSGKHRFRQEEKIAKQVAGKEEWRYWQILVWASLICSLFVGLYGLVQKLNLSFTARVDSSQMQSTLGNPIFLSVYAMMNLFLALILISLIKSKWQKILAILLSFLNLVVMLLGASRGVFLAFCLSIFLFILFLCFKIRQKKIKLILGILLAMIIVSFILLPSQNGKEWMQKMPVIIQRTAGWQSSVFERVQTWKIAWQGFLDRPILGWGWENFNVVFNKYYQPHYLRAGEPNTWFDRSHNQVTDLLALSGAIGTLIYLAMFGSIFWLLLKKYRQTQKDINGNVDKNLNYLRINSYVLVFLGLMFLAYFTQNLTVFDTPAPLIMFYFSLALVYFLTKSDTNIRIHPNDTNSDGRVRIAEAQGAEARYSGAKLPIPILILLIFIFLPWAMYKFNIEPWRQSSLAVKAVQFSQRDLNTGLNFYKDALAKEKIFTNPETRTFLAQTMTRQKQDNKFFKEGMIFAITEMEKSTKEHPNDVRHWLNLGILYNIMALSDEEYLAKAEEVLEQAKILSPRRQTVYLELVKTNILQKDFGTAIQLAQEAVDLDPEIGEAYKSLSTAYAAAGNLEGQLSAMDEAKKSANILSDFTLPLYFSSEYFKLGKLNQAIEVAKMATERYPGVVSLYTHLAALYKEAGEKEKAIETVRKSIELDPSLAKEGNTFIESLEND